MSNGDVQNSGCAALQNLACNNVNNRNTIAREGGIKAILDAMEKHKSKGVLQKKGCSVLLNLARNVNILKTIKEKGGINVICNAMDIHTSNDEMKTRGCKIFWKMFSCLTYEKNSPKLDLVIDALKKHDRSLKWFSNVKLWWFHS